MNEWERLKEALRRDSPSEAAQAFADYARTREFKSKPMLVNLGKATGYPNAIPLDEIPHQLATNPDFFNIMKRVVK